MAESDVRSLRELRRAEDEARRRDHVLESATTVFARKGFHEAQITEIAAAAELSRASLYALFEGKEDLYREVIRVAILQIRDAVVARVESSSDPADRLLTLIDALFDCFEENHDVLRIALAGTQGLPWRIQSNLGDESRGAILGFRSWVIDLCQDAVESRALEGIGAEAFAAALIGSVTNAADHMLEKDPDRPLTRLAPGVREVFARALSRGGAT